METAAHLITTLSDYAASTTLSALPARVVERAKDILLDTLCAMLAASAPRYAVSRILLDLVRSQGGTPECALIGSAERTALLNAALYNGTLGYACDIESHHPEAIMHGPAIVVPAALAAAERAGRSGADLLAAIVLGVELACRVSLAIGPAALYRRGQHPTCVAGGFGSATAAGRLLGLEAAGLHRAWGLTGTQASGLLAWETDPSENSRPFNPGLAARNGTTAALLASAGFGGPPDIFSGKFNLFGAFGDQPRPGLLLDGLGERFAIEELAVKRYACCAFLHPGLDGLEEIMAEQGLAATEIDAICIRFPRSGVALIDNNPLRSHCGQYIFPIYALERKVVIDDILVDRSREPAIAAFIPKVQVLGDEGLDGEFPARYTTLVEVEARGQSFARRVPYARGCPENPLSRQELADKFLRLASPVAGAQRARAILAEVGRLDSAPGVSSLIGNLQFTQNQEA